MAINIKDIIIDQREALLALRDGEIARSISIKPVSKKATVITGIRRSGKSTLIKQLSKKFLKETLYVSFFDERLVGIEAKDLNSLLECYSEINDGKTPKCIILDEIQLIEGWEFFVSRIVENANWSIYIAGSSSRMLSQEIASELRGRSIRFDLFPFSFREFLIYKKISMDPLTTAVKGKIKKGFLDYLIWGGFPETISVATIEKQKILNEYLEVLLFRDIVERNAFERTAVARRLFLGLIKMYSNPYSINQTHKKLKVEGLLVDKGTLSDFLRWCEDAFVLFSVSLYSKSEHVSRVNPQKLYLSDVGLSQACEVWDDQNLGRRFENLVFISLRALSVFKQINYYLTASKYEVDFLFQDLSGNKHLIQVCWQLNSESEAREIRSLDEAMGELNIKRAFIITYEQSDVIRAVKGKIRIMSIFDFFLATEKIFK